MSSQEGGARVAGIPGPIWRLAVVAVLAVVALVVVRAWFVPETFGDLGHYRASALGLAAGQQVRYGGLVVCAECHVEEAEVKSGSYHRGLTCEGCHGAAADHANDPTTFAPVMPSARTDCLRCHDYLSARPTGFPQIIERLHNPLQPCVGCHDPHEPTPPELPGACSACHAAIERTKAVSHHWSLDCETCHETPAAHRENPRGFLPKRPSQREFCGGCHAHNAASPTGIPRVDMATHGDRYLCWQCHYPHHPESG